MVLCLFLLKVEHSGFYHKPLLFMGEISYGLYLFHPIVYSVCKFTTKLLHLSLLLLHLSLPTFFYYFQQYYPLC